MKASFNYLYNHVWAPLKSRVNRFFERFRKNDDGDDNQFNHPFAVL